MNDNNKILLTIIVSIFVGLLLSTAIISGTLKYLKQAEDVIIVKGTAEKQVISDTGVWGCTLSNRAKEIKTAFAGLEQDKKIFLGFVQKQGFTPEQTAQSAVRLDKNYKLNSDGVETNELLDYTAYIRFEIKSSDVKLISQLAKNASALLGQGLDLASYGPNYYINNVEQLKLDLLGEATRNGRLRAEQFAKNSNKHVGALKYASQGIFQITAPNSTELSGYGVYDTSTIRKNIMLVVSLNFAIH